MKITTRTLERLFLLKRFIKPLKFGTYSWNNIPYFDVTANYEGENCLDVFIPKCPFPRPQLPVCLFVHGGAWSRGDKRNNINRRLYANIAEAMCRHQIVTVLANHRLSPSVQHPEHAKDIARCVVWIYQNISKFGGNPQKILLMGHSSGAHLLAFCLSDQKWLEEQGDNAIEAFKSVKAFVGISGPYNLHHILKHPFGPLVVGEEVFGPPDLSQWALASPLQRCQASFACPLQNVSVLLLSASQDLPWVLQDSEDLITALKGREVSQNIASGHSTRAHKHTIISDENHMSIVYNIGQEFDAVTPIIMSFLKNDIDFF